MSAYTKLGSMFSLVHTLFADSAVPMDTAITLVFLEVLGSQEFRERRNSWQKGQPKERSSTRDVGRVSERGRSERDRRGDGMVCTEEEEEGGRMDLTSFMEFHIDGPDVHSRGMSEKAPDRVGGGRSVLLLELNRQVVSRWHRFSLYVDVWR